MTLFDPVKSIIRVDEISGVLDHTSKNLLKFGVDFLDDALIGILETDLIVLSGVTGHGKTQLAMEIALSNARQHKNVHYIALEGEDNEIELRIIYKMVAALFFKDPDRPKSVHLTYRTWRYAQQNALLKQYTDKAKKMFKQRMFTLHTIYGGGRFRKEDLLSTMAKCHQQGAELILADHLHYFDITSGADENSEVAEIMKATREGNLKYKIPTIMLAHLNKNFKKGWPDISDIMGTSNTGKICTCAIMVQKDTKSGDYKNGLFKTIISVPKGRAGGVPLAGIMTFDVTKETYSPDYRLAFMAADGEVKMLEDKDYPRWAVKRQDLNVLF